MRGAATAFLLACAVVGAAGCGGSDPEPESTQAAASVAPARDVSPSVEWVEPPGVFAIPELPTDKVLRGRIRNATGEPLDVAVDRVDVRDGKGRRLRVSVRFAEAFGHALYGPGGPPAPLQASRYDQARLGERVTVPANENQPITLAWREQRGAPAETVKISGYTLELPR